MSQQINFYHAEFRPKRVLFSAGQMLLAWFGLIPLLAAWSIYQRADLDEARRALAERKAEETALEAKAAAAGRQLENVTPDPELTDLATRLEKRLANLKAVEALLASGKIGTTRGFSADFVALAQADRPDVWLTRLSFDGDEVEIEGRALDSDGFTRYLKELQRQGHFQGMKFSAVQLGQAKAEGDAEPSYLQFSLRTSTQTPTEAARQPSR